MSAFAKDQRIFRADYTRSIKRILDYRDLNSGTHQPDPDLVEDWINAQLTERRQRAARNFANSVHYFTINQLFEQTRNVIIKLYRETGATRRYFWVGENKKSSYYFMGIIALYLIKQLGYEEPLFMLNYDPEQDADIIGESPVIILDDCSYSGNQMINLVYEFVRLGQRSPLYLCTAFATEYSLERYHDIDVQTPLHPLTGQVIPNLIDTLDSLQNYLDIRYYFSPFTEGMQPVAIVYFDHKMPVENSTYMRTLTLGPVLPGDLGYTEDISYHVEDFLERPLGDEFVSNYLADLEEDNVTVRGLGQLESRPFVTGCEVAHDISNLPYSALMYSFNEFYLPEYQDYEDILKQLHPCPSSFYKELF